MGVRQSEYTHGKFEEDVKLKYSSAETQVQGERTGGIGESRAAAAAIS